jgi:hypothetical protein
MCTYAVYAESFEWPTVDLLIVARYLSGEDPFLGAQLVAPVVAAIQVATVRVPPKSL